MLPDFRNHSDVLRPLEVDHDGGEVVVAALLEARLHENPRRLVRLLRVERQHPGLAPSPFRLKVRKWYAKLPGHCLKQWLYQLTVLAAELSNLFSRLQANNKSAGCGAWPGVVRRHEVGHAVRDQHEHGVPPRHEGDVGHVRDAVDQVHALRRVFLRGNARHVHDKFEV